MYFWYGVGKGSYFTVWIQFWRKTTAAAVAVAVAAAKWRHATLLARAILFAQFEVQGCGAGRFFRLRLRLLGNRCRRLRLRLWRPAPAPAPAPASCSFKVKLRIQNSWNFWSISYRFFLWFFKVFSDFKSIFFFKKWPFFGPTLRLSGIKHHIFCRF